MVSENQFPAMEAFLVLSTLTEYLSRLLVLSHIISQLRPGADLSRVVLPTFILEPRSMLERITKYEQSLLSVRHQLTASNLVSWHTQKLFFLCQK